MFRERQERQLAVEFPLDVLALVRRQVVPLVDAHHQRPTRFEVGGGHRVVDLDGMAETAAQSGDICVSEAFVFEPDAAEPAPGGVYACCVDAFDPDLAEEDE